MQTKSTAYEGNILTMPDGPAKTDFELELQKLRVKLAGLLKKEGNYRLQGMLQQQADFVALGGQITALQTHISALNARRAQL